MNGHRPLVLMIEDNPDVLRLNGKWLERAGFDTASAESLACARRVLESCSPDIIVLDILLPDGDGLRFLPELKALCGAPVLLCSSRNEDKDVLRGLEAGGDDYIAKPYNVDILVARVSVIWRYEQKRREDVRAALAAKTPEREIIYGPLRLDVLTARAYVNERDAGLTPKQFALLFTLAQNEGREVSARELYEAAWGLPSNADTRTVRDHISKLRSKLSAGDGTLTITSKYGSGYRLIITDLQL